MYFFNQILAALLLSAALVGGIKTAAQSVFPAPGAVKIVYPVEALAAAPASPASIPAIEASATATIAVVAADQAAAAPAAPASANIGALIAAADPALGEKQTTICKACHTFDKGGRTVNGPNLWGVVGRDKASVAGYAYSPALSALEGNWTYEDLDQFLTSPMKYAKGTKMAFAGVPKPEQRAAIIAYLRKQADAPAPLPGE